MGRYAGLLLGVGLTITAVQVAGCAAVWALWVHDVRRAGR